MPQAAGGLRPWAAGADGASDVERFAALLEPGRSSLWIDALDYGRRLWPEESGLIGAADRVAWLSRLQGLLHSDVVTLDLWAAAREHLDGRPSLRAAVAARPRPDQALRTLLADEGLRGQIKEWVMASSDTPQLQPLCLRLVSPIRALRDLATFANGAVLEAPDEDSIDSAAVYLADFLRVFGECGVEALVLKETDQTLTPSQQALYRPILNVAAGYRWATGLMSGVDQPEDVARDYRFSISPQADRAAAWRLMEGLVPQSAGRASPSRCYWKVPAEADPEAVMMALEQQRAAVERSNAG